MNIATVPQITVETTLISFFFGVLPLILCVLLVRSPLFSVSVMFLGARPERAPRLLFKYLMLFYNGASWVLRRDAPIWMVRFSHGAMIYLPFLLAEIFLVSYLVLY